MLSPDQREREREVRVGEKGVGTNKHTEEEREGEREERQTSGYSGQGGRSSILSLLTGLLILPIPWLRDLSRRSPGPIMRDIHPPTHLLRRSSLTLSFPPLSIFHSPLPHPTPPPPPSTYNAFIDLCSLWLRLTVFPPLTSLPSPPPSGPCASPTPLPQQISTPSPVPLDHPPPA